jgi:GDP-L-fucose synthase
VDLNRQRILVTGGSGFLGGFVQAALERRGVAEIIAPRSSDYDLVSGDAVRALLRETRPDIVIHLAARVGGIGANKDNPATFFYDNLMMGVQLIHESYHAGVQKLVAAGTICAYPKFCPVPFREEEIWNGYPEETNAPYGLAKKMLSVQSAAYRQQFGFNSAVVYPVNLYGPHDNFDLDSSHVIPALIRKFVEAKQQGSNTVTLWGDGSPTREFFYVEDCAEAIVRATERYDDSTPLNLGSGEEVSIRELSDKIRTLVGFRGAIVWDTEKPNGQPRRRLDVSRAEEQLDFRAEVPLDEGLQKTLDWYERFRGQLH